MMRQIKIVLATLAALVVLDVLVAAALTKAPGSLRSFFDYGRSVPGKLAQWEANPNVSGNLLNVAWLPEAIATAHDRFIAEPPDTGPVVRNYGMSFSNQMVAAAQAAEPALRASTIAGPGASPNFVYAAFLDDRANRRPGDVVLFGILSKSVPALGSFSNRVWAFEQPAPFTYPIFRPDAGGGLERIDPEVRSFADFLDPAKSAAFAAQMQAQDLLWTPGAFALPALDASPFARLVRRAVAKNAIDAREAEIVAHPEDGPLPWAEVLRRMVEDVARITREDGQIPVIMLIQSQGTDVPSLRDLLRPTLEAGAIPYLATEDTALPTDARAYVPDGHFTAAVNRDLAQVFLSIPAVQAATR
ncbi:hypothetical protein [Paenirhodobacter populi]|uniref:SGNH/GDSL hydrolase family protein n=1 Tax=Paenirhodobacter populi TaxID=2306993 RepID=A0A443JC10_9RHOB|nr:hypothetical protein [Sinirhodobacter populi]RWR18010.1 hypothetical protein D2T30_17355 [Sinirhodobacter populi]